MSSIKKASQSFGTRVLVVMGAKSTGKTTFVCTGSKFAPKKLPCSPRVELSDCVFIQNDTNGVLGPYAIGLEPHVVDLSDAKDLHDWKKRFDAAYAELKPLFADGTYRILGMDLSMMDKLWRDLYIAQAEHDTPKNWDDVSSKSLAVYRMLRTLPNATIVIMTHVNVPAEIASKTDANVLIRAQEARDAQAVGGSRATTTTDLSKSSKGPWWANADAILTMKRKKLGEGKFEYNVRIAPSNKVEAGGRWESFFNSDEPAHLRTLLDKVYGPDAEIQPAPVPSK